MRSVFLLDPIYFTAFRVSQLLGVTLLPARRCPMCWAAALYAALEN
jgi:hypothetical protein